MSVAKVFQEARRLMVLRFLEQSTKYTTNELLLGSLLNGSGHTASSDMVRSDIAWLEEQGLVTKKDMVGLWVVTISQRGNDVALGLTIVPGVRRLEPGL